MLCRAQSSVTLYGNVDAGVGYTNNISGGSAVQMINGRGGSFFGLKGVEDLGGGMKATFWLENGFTAANGALGQNGALFGRQAQVGLAGKFGALTLGNQYDTMVDNLQAYSSAIYFAGSYGAAVGDVDNVWGDWHVNNSVKYVTPVLAGFKAEGIYSFGGQPGTMAKNRIYGTGISYARGIFSAGAAYMNVNNPAVSIYQGTTAPIATQSFGAPFNSRIYKGYLSAQNLQIAGAGASVVIDQISLNALYTNTRFRDITPTVGGNQRTRASFNTFELDGNLYLRPDLIASAGILYTLATGANYLQPVAGVNYLFSKRTLIYLIGTWMRANGIDSTGAQAVANIANVSPSSNRNQIGLRIGLRSRF
ncbi:porin [Burkholderia cenocepacia]|uniref:porin n=1 Tax=Burkholderia cenocepacia TaxID=95486 RepID=UPI0027DB6764|nr:porin [Burkholderia cenocepacia]